MVIASFFGKDGGLIQETGALTRTLHERRVPARRLRAWAAVALCALSAGPIAGGKPTQTPQNHLPIRLPVIDGNDIRFTHVTSTEGQPHSRVAEVTQDNMGFIWLTTQDGLQRFDGYRFRVFRHDPKNPNSIGGSDSLAMAPWFRTGRLWVATDLSLDAYDPVTERFTHYKSNPRAPGSFNGAVIFGIDEVRDGTIWVSTDDGLNQLDPVTGRTIEYHHRPNDPTSLSSDHVRATFEERDGTFWVAGTEGLDVLDRTTGKVTQHISFPPEFPRPGTLNPYLWISFCEDHNGVLWAGFSYGYGLARVDRKVNKLIFYSLNGAGTDNTLQSGVRALLEDEDGILWVGSSADGLLKMNHERTALVRYRNNPSDPDSLSSDQINSLFEDREANIWVGTTGGWVNRFSQKPLPFRRYRHEVGNPNSLDSNYCSAVLQDGRGDIWIGSIRVLTRIDAKTGRYTFYRTAGGPGNLSSTWVIAMAEDRAGKLWFGTIGGGLNRFDPKTGKFKAYLHDPADPHSLSHNTVLGIHIDRQGTLWAGTEDGLDAFDERSQSLRIYTAGRPEGNRYRSIADDPAGGLWLGTLSSGLQHFDPASGQFKVYLNSPNPGSLSSNTVNSLYVDSAGRLWVATTTGLNLLDPKTQTFRVFDQNDGLPNSNVNAILEDARGNLWISTNNGLSRFDPRTRTFRNYSVSDGLLGNEFYNYASAYKSPRGEMFFNNYAGVISFFPQDVVDNPYIPPVALTGFLLFNKPVPIGGKSPLQQSISVTKSLVLTHEQSIFSFEFAALSYANPDRNRYRYMLEGLEKTWNEVGSNQRLVTYTTLPPGHYTFRVQGSSGSGVWNLNGVSVDITILPPWYQTAGFRMLSAATFLLLLLAAHLFRVWQLRREFALTLEARVGERTSIARDLHDTLLQSFHGLLLRFQTASQLLPDRPIEAKEKLDSTIERAADAITEGRDAVQGLRASTLQTNDLAQAVNTLGEELTTDPANPGSPRFRVMVEGETRDLHPILRDEIYRIAAEALRNAFRHAQAQNVEVEIRYDDRQFRMHVRDDGKGMDAAVLSGHEPTGHFGLNGMRERAKLVGGDLTVWSEVDAGTEVELSVPAGIAYTDSRKGSWWSRTFTERTKD